MEEYISGKHSVLEALRSGRTIHKVWISAQAKPALVQPVIAAAKAAGVVVQQVDKRKLDEMSGDVQHQGVVAQASVKDYVDIDDILADANEKGEAPFLILLDEIEDPHNLGSILRSADCTGAHGVVIPKRRSVGLTAAVSKTSAGAVEYVPVARVANLARTIDALKEKGIWIAGADASAEQTVHQADWTIPTAIVIGNEHKGLGRLIREKCDFLVKLPMRGHIDSLNASVAAGVFMYEVLRQRNQNSG